MAGVCLVSTRYSGNHHPNGADWCFLVTTERLQVWLAGRRTEEPEDQPLIQDDLSTGSKSFMLIPLHHTSSGIAA